jgi:hypothetical protein
VERERVCVENEREREREATKSDSEHHFLSSPPRLSLTLRILTEG